MAPKKSKTTKKTTKTTKTTKTKTTKKAKISAKKVSKPVKKAKDKKEKDVKSIKKENEKEIKKYDSATVDNDIHDEHGNWDGSVMTDDDINSIKDERAREIAIKMDQKRELLKELRDQDDKDLAPDISNLVMEIQKLQRDFDDIMIRGK